MTDAPRARIGSFAPRTVAPGRRRPGVGIVWLHRLTLVSGDGEYPSYGPNATAIRSAGTGGEESAEMVATTVEVPPGYLVTGVRVGYGAASGAFVGELRVADLQGARKSALVFLERPERAGELAPRSPDADAPPPVLDASPAPIGQRTLLAIRASVSDRDGHVAVRGLSLHLTRA